MKEILDPLALIPGVRMTALISEDGVPIVTARGASRTLEDEDPQDIDHDDVLNSFTALAAGWLGEISRAVGQLSWSPPTRVVLRATQGELVLQKAPGAVVLVVLERGVTAEELRVPMEGAIARMHRVLRNISQARSPQTPANHPPPGTVQVASTRPAEAGTPVNPAQNPLSDSTGDQ